MKLRVAEVWDVAVVPLAAKTLLPLPECQGTGTRVRNMGTHEVTVVDVVPSLCQPRGDAVKSWGSVRVWKPSVRTSLVIGRTRYCIKKEETVRKGRAQPLPRTDRGFRNEVCHREHLVRVRVHKRLHPCSRTLILNLYNVRESSRAVRLYQELKRCRVSVVGTIQCLLCCSDRVAERYSRSMVRRASFIKSTRSTTPRGHPNICATYRA